MLSKRVAAIWGPLAVGLIVLALMAASGTGLAWQQPTATVSESTAVSSPIAVSGTVTGPAGPVAGATMFYLSPCNQEFGNTVETDATGHYTFTLESSAEVCIVAVPPLPTKLAQAQQRITVTQDTSRVDFAVEPGRLLSGRVVDQNGRPAPVPMPGNIPWKLMPMLYDYWDGSEEWRRWWLVFNEFSEFTLFLPSGQYFMTAIDPFPGVDLRDGDVSFWEVVADVPPQNQALPRNITYDEPPPLAELITISPPDESGQVHVTGLASAVPGDVPYLRLVNLFTGDFANVPVAPDGSFEADIHAPYGSALHLRTGYWSEFYWAEATGTTLWVYPPDAGSGETGVPNLLGGYPSNPEQVRDSGTGDILYYLTGRAGNGGWWAGTGSIHTVFTTGDVLSTTLTVTITSPAIDECFDSGDIWLRAVLNLEPFFDADGWPRQRVNRGMSTLVAPTGVPIENNPLWRHSFYTPLTIQDQVQLTAAHRISHTLQVSFDLSGIIPPDLPTGHYRPALYLRMNEVGGDPFLGRLYSTPLLSVPEDEAPPRLEVTFGENFGAYYLPMIKVGDPAPPRLIWHLLTNTFSNGVRGVTAREDRGHFALSNRIAYQTDHLIVPRLEEHSRLPITYRLEPFLPTVSWSIAPEPIPPMIPFAFPSGQLHVAVQRPDGAVDDLGTAAFRQAHHGMPEPRYQYYIGSDRTLQRLYEVTTLSPQFEYQFPLYGRYLITMTGTLDDIWGNTYQGGGTYEVYVAEPLDLEGVFSGTPFEVGDALSPAVVVQPAVPATVTIQFRLYPDSDPAQAITHTLTGRANRFGYFYPLVNWETGKLVNWLPGNQFTSLPIYQFTTPGEYVLNVTAQYWDETGTLWMASTRGAGVVETPASSLVGHGQRGVTKLMDNRPQWFFLSQIHPDGLKENAPDVPEDQAVMVLYPYQYGDVLWVADLNNSIIGEVTAQDTEGSFADLVLSRAWQSKNPTNHLPGLEIPERVAVNEIPMFNTTPTGLDPALFPEAVDQWGYFYLSAQRPGISVRGYIGQAWFYRTYWSTDYKYDRQFGHGRQGDLENDIKLQFGGGVVRLLGDDRNEYLGYASTEILIRPGTEEGNRCFPPFEGAAGGPDGGPLLTLKGEDINLFITPTGVRPGTVLEVGDTFSFSGVIWPNLASRVWITATAPSGAPHLIHGQANKYGYFYAPDGDGLASHAIVGEPGRWTVDVHLVHDGYTSAGNPVPPYPTGDLLGSRDGQFYVYVVERDAPPLSLNVPSDQFLSGPVPVLFSGTIPSGWQNVTGTFTAIMSGYILEEGELAIEGDTPSTSSGRRFSYTFDPLRLHGDFPNLDVIEPEGSAALADTFTFSFLLSGQENGGRTRHRARTVTLQGQRLMALSSESQPGRRVYLPLILRQLEGLVLR
jgi:hypothetical protein